MQPQQDIRGNEWDVTQSVRVDSPADVRDAVRALYAANWPGETFTPMARAFRDLELAFSGHFPGYHGLDTVYHDQQHTLDVTLAMARLLAGYERAHAGTPLALGAERACVGILLALFHDIGYLREHGEPVRNGAEFTRNHVSRSARFLDRYLPAIGYGQWAPMAREVVHFTGYEKTFGQISASVRDPLDIQLGHLLGTADMIAQMADRCYLEKCRDRLYPEFVLGGVALPIGGQHPAVRYASGLDLLRQTPLFMEETRRKRLDEGFAKAYRYVEPLFDGRNPYIEAIDRSLAFLKQVLRTENWRRLRRDPRPTAEKPETIHEVRGLMTDYFKRAWMAK
jgi:hypothetical protein